MRNHKTTHIIELALLTTLALCLSGLESLLPPLVPIYGVKPGLANTITLLMLAVYTPVDILLVLLARILLSGILFGQLLSVFYSLAGGLTCFLVCVAANRFLQGNYLIIISVLGALAHNAGQLCIAILLTKVPQIMAYLPVLCISGVLTGCFTGVCASFLKPYLKKLKRIS